MAGTVARAAENVLPAIQSRRCAKRYLVETARRAWRRDLTPEEQRSLELQFDQDVALYDWPGALELGIAYLLQVPDFLYFPEFGTGTSSEGSQRVALTSYEVASRLSYLIWNSMPDETLLELARADKLRDRETVVAQAWRMLGDIKAQRGVWDL